MKTRIFWICFAFGLSAFSAEPVRHIGFGIKGAPMFSSHWSPENDTYGADIRTRGLTASSFGASLRIGLGGWFSLQPEVLVTRKGARHIITIPGFPWGDLNAVYEYGYVETPMLCRMEPFSGKWLRPFFTGGLYCAFLQKTEYRVTIPGFGTLKSGIDTMKRRDAGFASGFGLAMDRGRMGLSVEYRYSMGFIDLEFPTGPGFPAVKLRNLTHAVYLEIGFFR